MRILNPNNPVSQQLNDELFHKLLAIYMWKAGVVSFDVTAADIRDFPENMVVAVKDGAGQPGAPGRMEVRLITMAEAEQIVRKHGGRPF